MGISTKRLAIRTAAPKLGIGICELIQEMLAKNLNFEASISGGLWGEKPRWVEVPSETISDLRVIGSDKKTLEKSLDIGGILRLTEDWDNRPKGSEITQYATLPTKVRDLHISRSVLQALIELRLKDTVTFSSNHRVVNWYGKKYRLTKKQGRFIEEVLMEIELSGTFEIGHQEMADRASESTERFHDIFKNSNFKDVLFSKIKNKEGFLKVNLPADYFHN